MTSFENEDSKSEEVSNPKSEMPETKKHVRGSSLLLLGRFISLGVNLGTQVLLVRLLTESDFGSFSYMLSMLVFGSCIARLGMDKARARFVPIHLERQEWKSMAGTVVLVVGSTLTIGIGISLLAILFGTRMLGSVGEDPHAFSILIWLILLTPVEALETVLAKLFAIFARPKDLFFRRYILGPLLKLSAVLPLFFFGHNVVVLIGCYAAARVIGTAYSITLLLSTLRKKQLLEHFKLKEVELPVKSVLGFGFPLLATDLAFVLRTTLLTFLLEMFHGSVSVAAFRAVLPVARLNLVVSDSFRLLYSPAIAKLFARQDSKGVEKLYWDNVAWITLATAPMFLFSFSLSNPVTTFLFGERYATSGSILCWLSLGWYINAIFGFNALTLRMHGYVRPIVINDLTASAVAITLNLLLIPRWGAYGGAIAMAASLMTHNIINQWSLVRLKIVSKAPRSCIKLYAWVAIVAVTLLFIQRKTDCSLPAGAAFVCLGYALIVAANFRALKIGETFPELKRLPPVQMFLNFLKK